MEKEQREFPESQCPSHFKPEKEKKYHCLAISCTRAWRTPFTLVSSGPLRPLRKAGMLTPPLSPTPRSHRRGDALLPE